MNASLVVNPVAGNKAYKSIDSIEEHLKGKFSLRTFVTGKKGDAFNFAKNMEETGRIIVAGGDGTINEVINGILSSKNLDAARISLAIIPVGTANVMAKELGIPEDIEKASQLCLKGTAKKISLGRINDRYFSLMAGIGFDGDAVYGVSDNFLKKFIGKGAYIISGIKSLINYDPQTIKFKNGNDEYTGYMAVISNARCYGGHFHVTPDASITEPTLDICVYDNKTRRGLLKFVAGVLKKTHLKNKDVNYFKTSEIEISSPGTVHVQIDGDYYGTLPVKIEVVRDALNLIW